MTKPTSRNSLSDPFIKSSIVPRLRVDRETFGRLSESFARYLGTSTFIFQMSVFIAIWFLWNSLAPEHLRFDNYPFQFMTLMLSLQASYAAPLILLAQNRQDDRDRISMEEDRARSAQTKADTEFLARELAAVRIRMNDVTTRDYLRGEVDRLRDEVAELTSVLREMHALPAGPVSAKSIGTKKKAKRPKHSSPPVPAATLDDQTQPTE